MGRSLSLRIAAITLSDSLPAPESTTNGPLIAGLNDDVSTIAHQHVDVLTDGQHMNFAIMRFRIYCLARFGRLAGRRLQKGQSFRVGRDS